MRSLATARQNSREVIPNRDDLVDSPVPPDSEIEERYSSFSRSEPVQTRPVVFDRSLIVEPRPAASTGEEPKSTRKNGNEMLHDPLLWNSKSQPLAAMDSYAC
jgi:hypothetical protein